MRARIFAEENKKWWTLAAVAFGLFMIMLDNTVVNVALPSIEKDLKTSGALFDIPKHLGNSAQLRVLTGANGNGRPPAVGHGCPQVRHIEPVTQRRVCRAD